MRLYQDHPNHSIRYNAHKNIISLASQNTLKLYCPSEQLNLLSMLNVHKLRVKLPEIDLTHLDGMHCTVIDLSECQSFFSSAKKKVVVHGSQRVTLHQDQLGFARYLKSHFDTPITPYILSHQEESPQIHEYLSK